MCAGAHMQTFGNCESHCRRLETHNFASKLFRFQHICLVGLLLQRVIYAMRCVCVCSKSSHHQIVCIEILSMSYSDDSRMVLLLLLFSLLRTPFAVAKNNPCDVDRIWFKPCFSLSLSPSRPHACGSPTIFARTHTKPINNYNFIFIYDYEAAQRDYKQRFHVNLIDNLLNNLFRAAFLPLVRSVTVILFGC